MRFAVKIKGLRELQTALLALPREMRGEPMRDGLTAGAAVIQAGMGQRAPRDPVREGVTLAEEIVKNVIVSTSRVVATAEIGPSKEAFYGGFQELGTEHHAAQPFMRPALDEDGPKAVEALAVAMKAGTERVARQLAGQVPT